MPWDRTAGVIGPQGSGKTLDLLTPALLGAPGAALVTLTKVEDLLLSLTDRSRDDRPCVVLDPVRPGRRRRRTGADLGPGRRLRGPGSPSDAPRRSPPAPSQGAIHGGTGDDAARFYAAEAAKVMQAYFHAAALTGRTLDDVLRWVANPHGRHRPRRDPAPPPPRRTVLARPAPRRPHGDDRTAGQHHHHRATGAGPVLPGRHPPPLHPRPRPTRHRHRRRHRPAAAPSTCSAAKTPTPPPPR